MKNKKMLSPKQYAERIGKPYPTVMSWLQSGKLPQAVKTEMPTGHFWQIPEDTPSPEIKRGRPKTTKLATDLEGFGERSVSRLSKKASKKGKDI